MISIQLMAQKGRLALQALLTTVLLLGTFSSQAGSQDEGIAERIKPVGTVCVKGEDCAQNLTLAAAGGSRSAEEVYNTGCLACHASGAAGAPKFRDAADWSSRLGAGLDTLYANAINGKGSMPAKGLCPSCSDEEVRLAVDYMIEGL